MNAQEQFQKFLENYGGETANKSIQNLQDDPALTELKPFIQFILNTWRDPFVPALMNLSCQATNGNPKDTEEVAIAFSLMNLSFRIWDDIIDKTYSRKFTTTFSGKFGKNVALIVGGVISAKAFTLLSRANLDITKKGKINELIWNYWIKMANAETKDLMTKTTDYTVKDKLNKMKDETVNVQTCLKIGAIIGNGSAEEIKGLVAYGECLGLLLELVNDVKVSLNLTLELDKKIASGKLTYLTLEAKETSQQMKQELEILNDKKINSQEIGHIVGYLRNKGILAKLKTDFEKFAEDGQKTLNFLKNNEAKEKLGWLVQIQLQVLDDILLL